MRAAAQRFLHSEGGFTLPAPAKMSLYDLMGRFWQLDAERPFTPNETRLYFYWLNQFNAARWVACLPKRPGQVCADLGLTDKTLAVARVGLVNRGLMSYAEGHRRLSAIWALGAELPEETKESRNNSGLQTESAPKKAGIIPPNKGGETGVSPQESRNNSGDIYKEEEKTLTTTRKDPTPSADASGEAGIEKKIGEDFSSDPPPTDAAQLVPPVAPPPRRKPGKPDEPAAFADFWQAWPKKEARADAVKAFAKLEPDDQALAASRADTWLAARPDLLDPTRYRFIPHATTWLNQARWTDQAPALATSTHASPNPTSYPPRSVNGAKPLGHGGSLARLLAESD